MCLMLTEHNRTEWNRTEENRPESFWCLSWSDCRRQGCVTCSLDYQKMDRDHSVSDVSLLRRPSTQTCDNRRPSKKNTLVQHCLCLWRPGNWISWPGSPGRGMICERSACCARSADFDVVCSSVRHKNSTKKWTDEVKNNCLSTLSKLLSIVEKERAVECRES